MTANVYYNCYVEPLCNQPCTYKRPRNGRGSLKEGDHSGLDYFAKLSTAKKRLGNLTSVLFKRILSFDLSKHLRRSSKRLSKDRHLLLFERLSLAKENVLSE